MTLFDRLFRRGKTRPEHIRTGQLGERAAARYLRRSGYRILERNRRNTPYEIDIIAAGDGCTVLAEVKTRCPKAGATDRFGTPASAVNAEKRRHLIAAAREYIAAEHPRTPIRFDVIEVYLDPDDKTHVREIHHIRDAFRP